MKDERWNFRDLPKWKQRILRAWRALRGETWVYLRLHCFACDSGYDVEIREEWTWPLIGRCKCKDSMSLKSCAWNRAPVFPVESQRQNPTFVHEAKTGEHLTTKEGEELERKLGYGSKWWQTETLQAIRNRYAVRKEHEEEA